MKEEQDDWGRVQALERKLESVQEDKRATFHAMHAALKKNKDTLTRLKLENKEIRNTILAMRKERNVALEQEKNKRTGVRKIEDEVNKLKTLYNELKNVARQKEDELAMQRDSLNELRQATLDNLGGATADQSRKSQLSRSSSADASDPRYRRIRLLENRLEKTLMKVSEASQFEKTYEQIIRRLREERVGFDNIIQSITETLEGKKKEVEDLLLVSMEAQRAKDNARKELQRMESVIVAERKVRDKELEERRRYVQAKIDADRSAHQRAEKRKDIQHEARGDLSKQEEDALQKAAAAQPLLEQATEKQKDTEEHRVTSCEGAFRKIRDATGVADLNEVVMKFLTQEETKKQLQQLSADAQAKLDKMTAEQQSLAQKSEELKYSGTNANNRKIADEYDAKLRKASAELDAELDRSIRLEKTIVELKQGIANLTEKLDGIRVPGCDMVATGSQIQDTSLQEVLSQCEQKLVRMIEFVDSVSARPSSQPLAAAASARTHVKEDALTTEESVIPSRRSPGPSTTPFMSTLTSDAELPKEIAANNIRIDISDNDSDSDSNEPEDANDSETESGDEVQGRLDMKVRAAKLTDKEMKRRKKKERLAKGT